MDTHILTLAAAVTTNSPVILWGQPGVGKTATVAALADALGLPIEIVIAAIREPSDFSGLPVIADHAAVTLAPPAWAQRLADAGAGLLFLDEISTAPPAVQAALLRVIHDRWVGDLRLPDEVRIIAAANPPDQAAGGWELAAPLANRFVHIQWPAPKVDAWVSGLVAGWQPPAVPSLQGWQDKLPAARGLVSAYVQTRPNMLLALPNDASAQSGPWPSPRSWETATRLLAAVLTLPSVDEGVIAATVGAAVGDGPAIELAALASGDLLPDPKHLLTHPDAPLPERADKLLVALETATAYAVSVINSPDIEPGAKLTTWKQAWDLLNRAAVNRQVDVAANAARSLARIWVDQYARTDGLRLPLQEQAMQPFSALLQAAH